MHLSDHDLRQLDDASLERLSEAQARALLGKAVADLKRARERLGQHPGNSSRPPSSRAPWGSSTSEDGAGDEDAPAPACCAFCAAALDASHKARAHNARYEIDLVQPGVNGTGLVLQQTKHTYFDRQCPAGIGRVPSLDVAARRRAGRYN